MQFICFRSDELDDANGRKDAGRTNGPFEKRFSSRPGLEDIVAQQCMLDSAIPLRHVKTSNHEARNSRCSASASETHRLSLPASEKESQLYLSSPEHKYVRTRRRLIDKAIPKFLQRSRISCDLHSYTQSDEAGQQAHCEDVAERNRLNRQLLSPSSARSTTIVRNQAYSTQLSPIQYSIPRRAGSLNQAERNRPGHTTAKAAALNIDESAHRLPAGRSQLMYTQCLDPGIRLYEERRRSLSHKTTILDLRQTFGTLDAQSGTPSWIQRIDRDSKQTGHFILKRSRFDMPLPPIPSNIRESDTHASPATWDQMSSPVHPEKYPSCALAQSSSNRREDTSVYTRLAPAVYHETITHHVREITEEHIYKEIHKYHFHEQIQPVVEYEVLPARHFVSRDGEHQEITTDDLPLGTPSTEWFNAAIAAQLNSESDDEIASNSCRKFRSTDGAGDCCCTASPHIATYVYANCRDL